jgi:hypothetical protein
MSRTLPAAVNATSGTGTASRCALARSVTDRDVQAVIREDDGTMLLPGTFPIHDLPDLGVDIENLQDGDYITVAGLVLARLGHIPTAPGEIVDVDGHTAEVTKVTGRAMSFSQPPSMKAGTSRSRWSHGCPRRRRLLLRSPRGRRTPEPL